MIDLSDVEHCVGAERGEEREEVFDEDGFAKQGSQSTDQLQDREGMGEEGGEEGVGGGWNGAWCVLI